METKQNQDEWNLMSLMNQNESGVSVPVLPYNGSSGWSGTDTSKERADHADSTWVTGERQAATYRMLLWYRERGLTWKELADSMGWHHGQASSTLSVLHKEGKIARLLERRDKCRVYVLNEYVCERETDSQGRKPKACPNCGHVQ